MTDYCILKESDVTASPTCPLPESTCPLPSITCPIPESNTEEQEKEPLRSDCILTKYPMKELVESGYIVCTDALDNLAAYSYTKCGEHDSIFLQNSRGLVFQGNNLISQSFPFTPEIKCYDLEEIEEKICSHFDEFSFYPSYEGAVIRVLYTNDKWYVTTNKKLDAYNSKWGSNESFGELFAQGVLHHATNKDTFNIQTDFFDKLDKTRQYFFIVSFNQQNRLVCRPFTEKTIHIATMNNRFEFDFDTPLPIPFTQNPKIEYTTIKEVLADVVNADPMSYQGILAIRKISDGINTRVEMFKVLNPKYQSFSKIRGNQCNLLFRYLEIRRDKNMKASFMKLFDTFDCKAVERTLTSISFKIYAKYVNRFIQKQFVVIPPEPYYIMSKCHTWYTENKGVYKVTPQKVYQELTNEPAELLFKIHNRFVSGQFDTWKIKGLNEEE